MPAPRLTWNPDEAKQSLEVAAAIDAACKDATRRERARCEAHVLASGGDVTSPRSMTGKLLAAIRSGEPAPEAKS